MRSRGLALVGTVGVVAVILAIVTWRAADGEPEPFDLLGPRMGGFSFETEPNAVESSTTQVGFMAPYEGKEDPETLTFRSATAVFRENTADAVATISVCLPRGSANGNLAGGGVVQAPTLRKYCRETRPVVAGTTLRWGTKSAEGEILVLTIRPTKQGVANVNSLTFTYARDQAHGGQRRTERLSNQRFVVRAKPASR